MNTFWDDIKAILSRPIVKLIILILISLALCGIFAAEKSGGPLHAVQNAFNTITTPVSTLGIRSKAGLSTLSDRLFGATESDDKIESLKAENAKLKSQIIAMEKYRQEAERLQQLLDIKDQFATSGIAAHVVAVSGNAWNQTITISAGSEDGINAGQTVLGTNGVIGQVDSTNLYSSKVRLLTDPNSGVAVKNQTTGEDCILKGSLDGILYLEGIETSDQVSIGDAVITSGLGGSYVEGLIVGSVSQIISSESGVNRKVVVNPIERNSTITEVFVIQEAK